MKLLTSQQMQALDREAIGEIGIPSLVLMENAARAVVAEVERAFPAAEWPCVIVLAGKGNNGGDAIAVARILADRGYRVELLLSADPQRLSADSMAQLSVFDRLGLHRSQIDASTDWQGLWHEWTGRNQDRSLLIDGLFGSGLERPISDGFYAELVDSVNRHPGPIVAIDMPSGCCDAPLPIGKIVRSDLTVTLQEPKTSMLRAECRPMCGTIRVVDIGIPKRLYQERRDLVRWIEHSDILPLSHSRDPFAHKNRFGHGLAVVGSERMPGAGILAIRGAFAVGIGLCTALIPDDLRDLYVGSCPEAMILSYRNSLAWGRYSALLIGPGLGHESHGAAILRQAVEQFEGPLVLDADGLNRLAEDPDNLILLRGQRPWVLTPHVAEAARLLGCDSGQIEADRISAVMVLAKRFKATVVLKGRYSLVCSDDGHCSVNPTGNPGMATAGSGDVLAGILLGLTAQHAKRLPLEQIVCAAVWLHGRSGDLAACSLGQQAMKAGDLVEYLPGAWEIGGDDALSI